jgi:hypothetical protein
MKPRRRIAVTAAAVAALVLLLFAALPAVVRGPLVTRVKAQLDGSMNARVDWAGARVTLLRTFPNLTLRVDDVVVTGVDRFDGDTLVSAARFSLVLDAWSLLGSVRRGDAVVVRSVDVAAPHVRLLVLEDGTANWDVAKVRAEEAAPGRSLGLKLRRLEVRDGVLSLEDRQAGTRASVAGLHQVLSGDFGNTEFTLRSRTMADAVSFTFAGVPYLQGVRLAVEADIDVDLEAGRYVLSRNEVRLNELVLAGSGTAVVGDDSVAVEIQVASPATEFRQILSLVPAVYARDFEALRTAGTMAVSARVAGGIGGGRFPALAVRAEVSDGMFRYPDLPLPAEAIEFLLAVDNPGGSADSTVVALERLRLVVGGEPIEGTFVMRTPVSDPDVAFSLRGRADLADVARTVRLQDVDSLAGVITADASMRARLSHLERGEYERVSADGSIGIAGLVLDAGDLPHALRIDEARLRLTPRHAELASLRGRIGASDVMLTGELDNLLGFLLRADDLRGRARFASRFFDLDEWRSDDELQAIPVPGRLDFVVEAAVDRIAFDGLDVRDARGTLTIRDRRATLDGFRMATLGGSIAVDGYYETTADQPRFDVALRMTDVDVPSAFAGLATVRAFAPVARYASGRVSADVRLSGALGQDMTPVFPALTGTGEFSAMGVSLRDFPALGRIADLLHVEQLRNPALQDLSSTFEIRDGRLAVRPFDVRLGDMTMNVAGSGGIDQSLEYTLALQLPRAVLGAEANRAITGLVSRADRAGLDLEAAEHVSLGVQLGGTVTDPTVSAKFAGTARSAAQAIELGLREEAARRAGVAEAQVDSTAAEARRRAAAEAERLVAEAEARASAVRAEARELAETVRREGHEQADALVERATNPVARTAARAAADRLRRETDERADRIIREADARADALVAAARRGEPPDSTR